MSKFIKEVESRLFEDKRRAKSSEFDLLQVTQEIKEDVFSSNYYIQKEYHIGVQYETRAWLGEQEIALGALDHIKKRTVNKLKDAVYGDLRKIVYKLQLHLYERELSKALDDLQEIFKEID